MTLARLLATRALRILAILLGVSGVGYAVAARVASERAGAPASWGAILGDWLRWLAGAPRGDLGTIPGPVARPVGALVLEGLEATLVLLLLALLGAALAGPLLGLLSVDRRSGETSGLALGIALVGFSAPAFYLGILGIQAATLARRWLDLAEPLLPASGYGLDRHLVLPLLALAARPTAEIARLTAELVTGEWRADYLRMARAKGRSRRAALARHALPAVAGTVAVGIGATLRYLVSSAIVVELLFNWPGVARELARSVAPRIDGRAASATLLHPPTVASMLVVLSAIYLVGIALAELAAWRLDPRLRVGADEETP